MNKYEIKVDEAFNPDSYPEVVGELTLVGRRLPQMASPVKSEIAISFFKDHCLKIAWVDENKSITELLTSGFLKAPHVESLFDSCRERKTFRIDFENFIRTQLP